MKKVLSLVLAVVLVLGMSSVAFATKYTESSKVVLGLSGDTGGTSAVYVGSAVQPDASVKLYLYNAAGAPVTRQDVTESKITVKVKTTSGSSVLRDVDIKYDNLNAYVRVRFQEWYATTKAIDFEYTVYLLFNKTRDTGTEVVLSGTFEHVVQHVSDGDDYVYLQDSPVVEADDYIKKIEADLGDGVSIMARMFEGKKYYGHVSQEIKDADADITAKYADIDTVYYLSTIGLSGSGDIVKFDFDTNMYAYAQDESGNLVYVGRTNSLLPYYTKYFIASKELNVASATPDDDDDNNDSVPTPGGDGGTDNAGTGGDDVPQNVNDNPGTGC